MAARMMAQAQRGQYCALAALQANQMHISQLQPLSSFFPSQCDAQASATWHGRPAAAFASGAHGEGDRKPKKWVPDWLKERLPKALRPADEVSSKEISLDDYANVLKSARKLGKVGGYLPGTKHLASIQDAANLGVFEDIIRTMTDADKSDLTAFGFERRKAVAEEAGCDVSKVDECLGKYLWMSNMLKEVEAAKQAGRPLPQNMEDIDKVVGASWQNYRDAVSSGSLAKAQGEERQLSVSHQAPPPATSVEVPKGTIARNGEACPLAGRIIGKRTTCPVTKKKYKACCGKSATAGVALIR